MRRARLGALVCGAALALSGVGVAGCGSSSSSSSSGSRSASTAATPTVTSSSATTTSSARVVAPSHVERALLATRTTPRLAQARCRLETAAERAGSPFGASAPVVYTCALRRAGAEEVYDVQVLPSGCFVAERRRPGAAIYGCGVRR